MRCAPSTASSSVRNASEALAYGQRPREARVLYERRPAGGEIARRALAEPAASTSPRRCPWRRRTPPRTLDVAAGSCRGLRRRRRGRRRASRVRSSSRRGSSSPRVSSAISNASPVRSGRSSTRIELVAFLREGLPDVVEGSVRARAAPAPDGREALRRASCVANGQSSSTTGWRVCRHSIPAVGRSEAGVPTFSPIVKWRSCPSTRGTGRPEASQSWVKPGSTSMYTARRARCLSAACRRSPPGLTRSSASPAISSDVLEGMTREALAFVARSARPTPASPKRSTMRSNQGMLRQPRIPSALRRPDATQWRATELIDPDHVVAEPAEAEHPREPLPRDAPVPGEGRDRRADDEAARGSRASEQRMRAPGVGRVEIVVGARLPELGLREQPTSSGRRAARRRCQPDSTSSGSYTRSTYFETACAALR